jgi:LysM repeat protein
MDRGAGGTRAARPDDGLPGAGSGGRWGLRPTAPIVIEGPPSSLDPRVLVRSRRLGAIALVALMIAAFALVALARLPGLLPGDATSTATQSPPASEAASGQPDGEATPASVTPAASGAGGTAPPAAPQPTPAGSVQAATATPVVTPPAASPSPPAASPSPPAASPSPPAASPSPQATATARTYVVQRGDTLSSIARRFDTSVEAIAAANGITNPSLIGVGQLLVIP